MDCGERFHFPRPTHFDPIKGVRNGQPLTNENVTCESQCHKSSLKEKNHLISSGKDAKMKTLALLIIFCGLISADKGECLILEKTVNVVAENKPVYRSNFVPVPIHALFRFFAIAAEATCICKHSQKTVKIYCKNTAQS
jgi:hypothetical protein